MGEQIPELYNPMIVRTIVLNKRLIAFISREGCCEFAPEDRKIGNHSRSLISIADTSFSQVRRVHQFLSSRGKRILSWLLAKVNATSIPLPECTFESARRFQPYSIREIFGTTRVFLT